MSKSIVSLPTVLQAVWTSVYSQILTAHGTLQVPGMIGELSRERAEHEAWEAVRRANGGEMPGEQEREEANRIAILNEALAQPCPVTGEPFFMVLKHPDRGWVPTYGGPHDSWTAPEMCTVTGELSRWRYDHDEGAWAEQEAMGMRVGDPDAEHPEPTDEDMVEALAPIVARAGRGPDWDQLPAGTQDMRRLHATAEVARCESVMARAAVAAWKAARAWGKK